MAEVKDDIYALAQKAKLSPTSGSAWFEFGKALYDAGRVAEAAPVLARAAQLLPSAAAVPAYQGLAAQALGDLDGASGHYSAALKLNPRDNRTRHNLAVSLRLADRAGEALAEVERALERGPAAAETLTLRAHLLAELGRVDEAVEHYRRVLSGYPAHLDAQETLARLLPQVGRVGEALDSYRTALVKVPDDLPLWFSALRIAHEHKDHAALFGLVADAETRHGHRPEFAAFRAAAHGFAGEHETARQILVALVASHPDDHGLRLNLSHCLLCLHEPKAAEEHALVATRLAPLDQTAWSHLSIIWRLLGDPREEWLADYERFVLSIPIDLPVGLQDELEQLHMLQLQPAEQSLRGGTQTRGYLFDKRLPAIQQLGQNILQGVSTRLAALPRDESHPFLSRNSAQIAFSGAWSVRLKSEGFHINHIHPQGWLSSALYVALPAEIDDMHGALSFGVPDAAFGLDLPARRIEIPASGKLVIFPSYFWHGTLPFESATERLTVAFDALPMG